MANKSTTQKLAAIKLTEQERMVIAQGLDSEFFKILRDKVLPQRRVQIALTIAEADQRMEDVWYHRGMIRMCKWLPEYCNTEAASIDTTDYGDDEDGVSDDDPLKR